MELSKEVIERQWNVEDQLVGRLIEDNHLVDALFGMIAKNVDEDNPLVPIVQSLRDRSRADADLIYTLRAMIDALYSQISEMRIRISELDGSADEAAASEDNNGNRVRIVSTGWQKSGSAAEICDYQLIQEPGKGYLAVMYDGMPNCWWWYGEGEEYPSLPQMLASLAAGGHIVPAGTQQDQDGQ